MGQALLKEVPKLKEWPCFSGEGEYDHMAFNSGIEMIEEDFELPYRLVTAIFNTLFTRSAHRCYIKLRQAHGHQSWTWWKTKIIIKWGNDSWSFKVETAFESAKLNDDKDKDLPWFCQQKDILKALYPEMSGFMIHRKILIQCGGGHFILGNDYIVIYGIDIHNDKDRYFTFGENKCQKFALLPFKTQITVRKVTPVNLELEKFRSEQLNEVEISLHLTYKQENSLSVLLYDHKAAFASDKEPLEAVFGHEVDIILNIARPYPSLLRRLAYPESSKSREALEIHIKELLDLDVIRKVCHNE
ncbi:hypothetical protein O181_070035 [Austropuccinia psidii MF-1]|uniref:Uncharacterized protein n=1 Tax=Austropuccinia psidii MF-1 TaxID=1389203 RepID=A0A9Q3I8N2_9BASI|nr:hypothetical protein [Austropuccinia psidii MF-1]